jgi:serine acetyltransferase
MIKSPANKKNSNRQTKTLWKRIRKRIKRFKHFVRDTIICIWRGWDFRLILACDLRLLVLPKSTIFGHPVGIVISRKAILGENCNIKQNVTIGQKDGQPPTIGNNVLIGPNAIIIGAVKIGDNAVIGAGAIVLEDVPANSIYLCKINPKLLAIKDESIQRQ